MPHNFVLFHGTEYKFYNQKFLLWINPDKIPILIVPFRGDGQRVRLGRAEEGGAAE